MGAGGGSVCGARHRGRAGAPGGAAAAHAAAGGFRAGRAGRTGAGTAAGGAARDGRVHRRVAGDSRLPLVDLAAVGTRRAGDRGGQPARAGRCAAMIGEMSAAHFIFIPATLLIGVVIGWVLGSRAAQDAFAAELRRREERAKRNAERHA